MGFACSECWTACRKESAAKRQTSRHRPELIPGLGLIWAMGMGPVLQ